MVEVRWRGIRGNKIKRNAVESTHNKKKHQPVVLTGVPVSLIIIK